MRKIHFLRDAKSGKFSRRAFWLVGLSVMVRGRLRVCRQYRADKCV